MALSPFDHYDVFINLCDYNHAGRDVHTFATKLYDQLRFLQLQVFMDKPDLLFKDYILPSRIEDAILAASVHIAIFTPNYALSKSCLDELVLMTKSSAKSRSTIIPVFYYAKPFELSWTGRYDPGRYAEALRSYENQNLYDSLTIQKWRDALSQVAQISGFVLDDGHGGEEKLLNNVVESLTNDFPLGPRYDVFINHRGPDVGKTFARSLYDRLVSRGLRVFLAEPELVRGIKIGCQLEVAIQFAYVNIAIFSETYARSTWCLDELKLMVSSMATILPVFYKVRRSDVLSPDDGVYKKALLEYERLQICDSKTLQDWRDALSIVAKLPGHELDVLSPDDGVYKKALLEYERLQICDSKTLQDWRDALSIVAKLPGHELDSDEEELLDKTVQSVFEHISLSGCSNLQSLPDSIVNFMKIKHIGLSGCSNLQSLLDSFSNLTSLKYINLSGCSNLQSLPYSIGNLTSLEYIDLHGCSNLQSLPDSFFNLTNIKHIDLFGCSNLQSLPDSIVNFTKMEHIGLSGCSNLQSLPDSFFNLTSLKYIDLSGFSNLQSLPDSIVNFTKIEHISLSGCSNLQSLPDSFFNLTSLKYIDLSGCRNLQRLPNSFGTLSKLQLLDLLDLSGCSSLNMCPIPLKRWELTKRPRIE